MEGILSSEYNSTGYGLYVGFIVLILQLIVEYRLMI
ncbi:MAG: hypothetical protein CM15mP45_08990 [Deltaproteobacteria bacterium]|nr:MAG: hypothetical protein CM15mP45_08990 [Deltaproteobacteria bacterium]